MEARLDFVKHIEPTGAAHFATSCDNVNWPGLLRVVWYLRRRVCLGRYIYLALRDRLHGENVKFEVGRRGGLNGACR